MELRLLVSERERRIFAERVAQARANRDAGASETPKSRLTPAHIAFGNLYGLFKHSSDSPEQMIAGLVMHDLETLPQSYPKPDLSNLPPGSVVECGGLWSLVSGGLMLARRAMAILWRLMGVRAVLVYAIVRPWNTANALGRAYFENVGEPIEFPFARALDGSPVWVQPMVLWEEGIQRLFEVVGAAGFEVAGDLSRIRFDTPMPSRPSSELPAFESNETRTSSAIAVLNAQGLQATAVARD